MSGFLIASRKVKMVQESRLAIVIDSQNAAHEGEYPSKCRNL